MLQEMKRWSHYVSPLRGRQARAQHVALPHLVAFSAFMKHFWCLGINMRNVVA